MPNLTTFADVELGLVWWTNKHVFWKAPFLTSGIRCRVISGLHVGSVLNTNKSENHRLPGARVNSAIAGA